MVNKASSINGDGGPNQQQNVTDSQPAQFSIKPIKTTDDTGEPGLSVAKDLTRVLDLIDDERHLVAHELYEDIKARMQEMEEKIQKHGQEHQQNHKHKKKATHHGKQKSKGGWLSSGSKTKIANKSSASCDEEDFRKAKEFLHINKEALDLLDKRAPLFLKAKQDMDESENWTLAQTLFGISTYYRREDDDSLSIKLEGELRGLPLFEQVAVLREIDLHSNWAPFVTSSLTLAQFDKLDTVGWMMVGLPNFGIARDGCFRCIGCDCTKEDNSVIIYGQGVQDRPEGVPPKKGTEFLVEDPLLDTVDIPPVPTRIGSGRLTIRNFEARIAILSPDHCRTYVLANINPNLAFIPQSLLEFVMKKMCGFLLNKLQSAAKKTVRNPVRNIHAQRMRDDAAFYRDWLLPKFEAVARDKGWEMPTISAFELTEAQQMEAARLKERRASRLHSFSHFEAARSRSDSDGDFSTRSAPGLFRRRSSAGSESGEQSDTLSEISSLSGTLSSVWKNNPIANYLRDLEMKTQERNKQAVLESRQKAAARLQPRPFSEGKVERLKQLKMHKARKLRSRSRSDDSFDGSFGSFGASGPLQPVAENDASTVQTGRSEPYSPISAALQERGRWARLFVVSLLVLLLFVLLHADEIIPSRFGQGEAWWKMLLRELVTLLYMATCGVVHFLLCDVELIYAFEAFELGMKSGEQVKTFYRGQVRLAVALGSGALVGISILKAVFMALVKSFVVLAVRYYQSMGIIFSSDEVVESVASAIEDSDAMKNAASDLSAEEVKTVEASLPGLVFSGCSACWSFVYAVFDWQMAIFVRSNFVGRSIESLTTGTYGIWVEFLGGLARHFGTFFRSIAQYETIDESLASWRGDAISTLRALLLYTAVFLLVVLALLDVVAKSYRYRKPSGTKFEADTTNENLNPIRMPPKSRPPSSDSTNSSGTKRRPRFGKKRKEKLGEHEDSD